MTPHTRVACSLSADELPQRVAEMTALGKDALMSVSPDGTLHFRADEPTRKRLEAIVAAESECCSFLGFELNENDGELALNIVAPDGAEPVVADLVEAFAAEAQAA